MRNSFTSVIVDRDNFSECAKVAVGVHKIVPDSQSGLFCKRWPARELYGLFF